MTNEVFGRPITGDIPESYHEPVDQQDPALLVEALDAVLALEGVESIKWEQYTPGFNDGDPCVFSVDEPSVKLVDVEETGDYENGYMTAFDLRYHSEGGYDLSKQTGKITFNGLDYTDVYDAMKNLPHETGAHDVWLQKTFGDPAEVVATSEGFHVEYYEAGY